MASRTPARTSQAPRTPARRSSGDVVVAMDITGIPTVDQIADAIESGSKLYFVGDETGGSILPQVLRGAESADDLFAEGELEKIKDHLGETFSFLSVDAVRNSEFDEGALGIYLVASLASEDGEVMRFAVGSTDGIAKLAGLHAKKAVGYKIAFVQSEKKTKAGFYPINCVSRQPRKPSDLRPGEKAF